MKNVPGARFLKFQCTGCGNCCKEPLLPLTDEDVRRIVDRTGHAPRDIVRVVDRHAIEMDDEPGGFAMLRQGKRVMVLRHERGRCRYLGDDDRCTIYESRPLGCRIYPFDPEFDTKKKLKRLTLVEAAECPYEMTGSTDVESLRQLHVEYSAEHERYIARIAAWNRAQRKRKRDGKAAQPASAFFAFMRLDASPGSVAEVASEE